MKNAMHFIGFKDDRIHNAIKVFGKPDFYHRRWDYRAREEMVEGDWAVFAEYDENAPVDPFSWDDSANDIANWIPPNDEDVSNYSDI